MRLSILTCCVCAALLLIGGARDGARADVAIRVVSESNGQIVVDFVDDGSSVVLPSVRFFVAIANEGDYSVSLDPGAVVKVDDVPLFAGGESVDSLRARFEEAADTVRVWAPFLYRGTRVIQVEVNLFFFPPGTNDIYRLATPNLVVTYDPAPATNTGVTADPMLKRLVVNEDVFPTVLRTSDPDPWFSLADANNWVKIPVTERGLYRVTGADLEGIGVPLSSINNSETLRLFSHFGVPQPREVDDDAGSWRDGSAMREAAILVEDGGDQKFDLQDRVVFYALGTEGWADTYDPASPDTAYYRHPRAKTAYYYLTWDSAIPGAPRRVAETDGTPGPGPFLSSYVHREYREKDRFSHFDFGGDGWLWLAIPESGIKKVVTDAIDVANLDAGRPQIFRTVAIADYRSRVAGDPPNLHDHLAVYRVRRGVSEFLVTQKAWTTPAGTHRLEDGLPVRHDGFFLGAGTNTFVLDVSTSPNPKDAMLFAWFSVFYHRFLVATGNAIGFASEDTTGTVAFAASGFNTETSAYVFDVGDAANPVRLTGVTAGSEVRFAADFAGTRRQFWVAKPSGLKRPSGMAKFTPVELRADVSGTNMLIITHESLRSAAERLRVHRERHLPSFDNARVAVVTTKDIFDNFSGGMPDAMAVRNYIKFMHDRYPDAHNNPMLAFVLLLGDANEDFRNNVSTQPDLVPSNLYFTLRSLYTFVTDEWFGHLDSGDAVPGQAVLDVAIGRLPAASATEAGIAVDKIIAYETAPTFTAWRNEIVLVADDEVSSSPFACDTRFTVESENITYYYVSNRHEIRKIYLTEHPRLTGIKPTARVELLDAWNDGALIVSYVGHGSSQQMADEQVFLGTDVGLLDNGLRLPLLLALSCTIGDFANYQAKSLSEKLILREGGGVIGTVTASRETFPDLNERLEYAIFSDITPGAADEAVMAVGESLARAKMRALLQSYNVSSQEENNWKYNLMTDPALRLRAPAQEIRFELGAQDTLVAGVRKTIHGAVYRDGLLDAGFNGSVVVRVREPDTFRRYDAECRSPRVIRYRVSGGILYEGTADVTGGRFEVTFRVPRTARKGPFAFITAYANEGTVDAATAVDSVLSLVEPTAADSLQLKQIDGAPRVALGFKSGLETVKPGETLQAIVRDADGINTLSTTNDGRQALLFDDLPVPIDANQYFSYDHGGADTSGVLLYPLPDLEFGRHRAIYKVSDAFGNTTRDTLFFDVTDPMDYFADVVLNYPNPFKEETQFLVRLSDRADIRLDIFTVSGRRIRRIEEVRDGGEVWIPWDGRDAHGSEIANGTYLYVATIDFWDLDRPPLVLRGKLAKIR